MMQVAGQFGGYLAGRAKNCLHFIPFSLRVRDAEGSRGGWTGEAEHAMFTVLT